jgi:2-keto-3-deoxy-L-rhamnonate aldolase RhmA
LGIDALILGPYDFCLLHGLDPTQQPHDRGEQFFTKMLEVAEKHGKVVGSVCATAEQLQEKKQQGALMLGVTDYMMLLQTAKHLLESMKSN